MSAMKSMADILSADGLFQDLDPADLEFLAGCAANEVFNAGAYLFRSDDAADKFFLIREGTVSIELQIPGRERLTIQSLHEGDIAGASWVLPPYVWRFDARALSETRATSIDAACLRRKCNEKPAFGFQILTRFLPVVAERLQATRMQLIDVYAPASQVGSKL